MNGNFDRLDIVMDRSDPFEGGGDQGPGGPNRDANDSAVRSFIGQGPSTPQALPLSVRTNSDLIHCSSQTATISGRTATQFQSERHSAKLLQTLNKFRTQKNGYLCDVTLKIGSKTFHVHKTILAGSSPYFEAMFTSCMEESSKQEIEIKGNGLSNDVNRDQQSRTSPELFAPRTSSTTKLSGPLWPKSKTAKCETERLF